MPGAIFHTRGRGYSILGFIGFRAPALYKRVRPIAGGGDGGDGGGGGDGLPTSEKWGFPKIRGTFQRLIGLYRGSGFRVSKKCGYVFGDPHNKD